MKGSKKGGDFIDACLDVHSSVTMSTRVANCQKTPSDQNKIYLRTNWLALARSTSTTPTTSGVKLKMQGENLFRKLEAEYNNYCSPIAQT